MKSIYWVFTALAVVASATQAAPIMEDATVLEHYADMAHAKYEDSLITAKSLRKEVEKLIQSPSEATLATARESWRAARVPYQQTEVYRFGNAIVDAWEGRVNAWPLDEGLIDYVDTGSYGNESDENPLYSANVIASKQLIVGGKDVDASKITKQFLQETLQEADEVEANVATGYHAIEFLLWGQDLNGTGPGAGNRPATDFDVKNCTNGNCDRRAAYLRVATELLIDDLTWMVSQWAKDGAAHKALLEGDTSRGLAMILVGMGSLSYGELAGERMKLGLMLHDPEEEHDCFSDNTHASHYYDVLGIRNVYLGSYTRIDGSKLKGAALSDLVAAKDLALDKELRNKLDATLTKMEVLVSTARGGESYDQMIAEGNEDGNQKVMAAIEALTTQTKSIEKAVAVLGLSTIEIEGSDSLDAPERVNVGS